MTKMNDEIVFNHMTPTGEVLHIKTLKRSDIMACPSFILLAEHYREDGTCRHDEVRCEIDGCSNFKFHDEIYCRMHLEEQGFF